MHCWTMNLVIFVHLLGIATSAVHRGFRDTTNEGENEDICVTQVCNTTATRIIADMDITINPCYDFYQFTCGGFLQRNLPSGAIHMSARNTAKAQLKYDLKSFFEVNYEEGELRAVKLAKKLYKTCMDEELIERKGLRTLKKFVEMLGGWPVVEGASWNESNFDWMATTAAWNRIGLPAVTFMEIGIRSFVEIPARRVLYISPPSWIIEHRNLKKGFNGTVAIRAYYTMMVDVAVSLGADREKAKVELKKALLFQIKLSNAIDASNGINLHFTLETLIEAYPRVDWRDTFARMYSPSQTIYDDDPVIVYSLLFIKNANDLVSRTPKRVLANFAMFQIIPLIMRTINKETVKKLDTYEFARDNYLEKSLRPMSCIDRVINGIPTGVVHIYAKKILKPETKVKFEDMVQNIREEFRAIIDKISLLDNYTSIAVKQKERGIETVIGYPNQLLDNNALEKHYENLSLYDNNLLNTLFLWKFDYDREVLHFRKPPNFINSTKDFRMLLTKIAYPNRNFDRISFSFNTLQGDLFDPEMPDYMNFGTAGTAIAHQIIHLFDYEGRLYANHGVNNSFGLFTVQANRYFIKQISCFRDQYGNYTNPTISRTVDGILILDENIADNASVKRAYHAYVKTMNGKAPEKRLFGLNYTPTQMFWIAYANKNCQKILPAYWHAKWNSDPHASKRFRVIGPLSNSQEFANDFKCGSGSKMNPVNKCSMW